MRLSLPKNKVKKNGVLWYARLDLLIHHIIIISPEQYMTDVNYFIETGYEHTSIKEVRKFVEIGAELPKKSILILEEEPNPDTSFLYLLPNLLKQNTKIFLFVPVMQVGKNNEFFIPEKIRVLKELFFTEVRRKVPSK